mmetsp:Transcript_6675/g.6980  ORF Transcript_6675/g.6980 Transcript_6675/m.6980 type:complete len:480 (+) Transcript_6675:46-1485(+)
MSDAKATEDTSAESKFKYYDDDDDTLDKKGTLSQIDIKALNNSLNIRTTSLAIGTSLPTEDNDLVKVDKNTQSTLKIPSLQPPQDTDPLVYEIYQGDYSNFRMRLRDLFLRISDITLGIDIDERLNDSLQSLCWREKHFHPKDNQSRALDGVGNVQSRDLRRLDTLFTPQDEPAILIRRHAVLISLDPIRVIVMYDRVVGFVPDGADTLLKTLYINMKVWEGESGQQPLHQHVNNNEPQLSTFEMRAYEAIFGTVVEILKQEEKLLREKIDGVVAILSKYSIIPIKVQDKVRQYKHEVTEKVERVKAHKNVIQDVMNDDELMALMNLSLLNQKPNLYHPPLSPEILGTHEDIEVMLDSLIMDYNAILSRLNLSRSKLESSEDMVSLRLDTARNQLLITNTVISVLALAFAMGSYVGSIWGMNLDSNLQETKGMFWGVTIGTTSLMIVLVIAILAYLQATEIIPKQINILNKRFVKQRIA